MQDQPGATVTFLFTDVEGSTNLVQRIGDRRYADLLEHHRALLRRIFAEHRGREIDTQGDAFFVVFPNAHQGVLAALDIQKAVATHHWPQEGPLRVRIGLHTGDAVRVGGAYVGVDVHRAARICGAGHGGQIVLSTATQALVAGRLPAGVTLQDLGEHRLRDLQRAERIFQLLHPHLPANLPALRSLSLLPHNLPVQLTSFVGRTKEIADLRQMLATARLLTLTGPGGSGKTRLALQLAAEALEAFPDGIWLVELAALSDPNLLPSAVAAVLEVREESGRPLPATLADFLQHKRLLLVLDNCEHLVTACAHIAESLLRAGPDAKILATSRERLGVPGETVYLVPPLSLPAGPEPHHIEDLVKTEAVRLFVERAAAVQPGFALTPANAAGAARVVQTLDGIPLAIELAAARVKVLSLPQIVDRLHDRFRLLTTGTRTAMPRQQTLQATMDWSFELLTEPERILLRRLGVFAGGFTLEAAERVCADEAGRPDVVNLLTYLVDKSLVIVTDDDTARHYRLLDTVREYAGRRLAEAAETDALRHRHLAWYLQLAEGSEQALVEPDPRVLDRLEAEHDNFRSALAWAAARGGGDLALRLATALHRFWHIRGHWAEGRQWLNAALAAAPSADSALRAHALVRVAGLTQFQGDYAQARALAEESLTVSRRLGDDGGVARALNTLGNIAYHQGDYRSAQDLHAASLDHARSVSDRSSIAAALVNLAIVADHHGDYAQAMTMCRDSLRVFRDVGDKRGIAFALSLLGVLASDQGDYATARPLFEESRVLQRDLGDRPGYAGTLAHLGRVAREQGDFGSARALYEESLALRRHIGNRHGVAASLSALGHVARLEERLTEAQARFRESLTLRKTLGDRMGIIECLEGLAELSGESPRAASLLGAAEALRQSTHAPRSPANQQAFTDRSNRVRATLGATAFSAAWERGGAMPPDEAAEFALQDE